MLEWLLSATEGSTLYVSAGVAVAAVLVVKYLNASADAANARAYEAAKARQAKTKAEAEKKANIKRRNFTLEELKEFNGENGKPIYIGVLDEVYDVSSKRDFYGPGEGYHLFAGRDASRALAKMSFEKEDLDSEDLSDLGFMDQETLQDWVTKFSVYNQYPNVGRIVRKRDLTVVELKQYNGVDNQRKTVYVALNGNIYDVTLDGWNHYGPEGGYKQFAGRDASRALACMSFLDEYLDNPTLAELTEQQKTTLENWEKKFVEKYPVVGKLIASSEAALASGAAVETNSNAAAVVAGVNPSVRNFTLEELAKYNGVDNPRHTVLVVLNGGVYDVTLYGWEHYGPDGGYHQFAGRDASRALACMLFLDEYLDNPSLEELAPAQRDALANWSTRFDQKYPLIGKLIAYKEG
ncbi:Heme/steroid binding domain-containing protein, partial [Globisporangium splendens]